MFDLKNMILASLLVLLMAFVGFGQISGNGVGSLEQMTGRRVMQTFDFDESEDLHGQELPMYWGKPLFKPGFPHFSEGKLDKAYARSGANSFKLIGDGGSVAFEYSRNRIKVKPGSDCMISGYVHLEKAVNCRAQISCALMTRKGKVIPGTNNVSDLIGMDNLGQDGWAAMEAYVPGNFPEARYLLVSIWLLQEEQWNKDGASVSRVFQNNIDAVAWFDDISIFQLPRVILRSDKAGNVFEANDQADLIVEVDGVTTLDYQIKLNIFGMLGEPLFSEKWMLAIAEGQISQKRISMESLGPGWYIAELNIISSDTQIAQRWLKFCLLGDSGNNVGRGNGFGINLTGNDTGQMDTAIALSKILKAERVKIPVWRKSPGTPGSFMTEPRFERTLRDLKKNHIEVTAVFSEMPNILAQKFDISSRSAIDIFSQKTELWEDQLLAVMSKYARAVMVWQVGLEDRNQVWDPRNKVVLQKLRTDFAQMFNDSVLIVPLNSDTDITSEQAGTEYIALNIYDTITPKYIPDYLEDFKSRGFNHIWATILPLDRNIYSKRDVIIDFAKRIIYAKKGQAEIIFIEQPWHETNRNGVDKIEPDEFFPVYKTLATELGAMSYLGQFELAPGINALIFNRDGRGTIVIWNSAHDSVNEPDGKTVEFYLGQNIRAVDIFGNNIDIPVSNGIGKVNLKDYPILISNIDSRIAELRAEIQLTPTVLEATVARQQLGLNFENPFSVPISGQIIIKPGRKMKSTWTIDPQTFNFALGRNGKFSQPISVKIPANEIGGKKAFEVYMIIEADKSYKLKMEIPFEVKLKGIDVSIFTRRINQNDLLIQQVVTNESDFQVSLKSFVTYPDRDRVEQTIPKLPPGETKTINYVIPDALQWLGQYIRIGLYDPKGTRRINHLVEIN